MKKTFLLPTFRVDIKTIIWKLMIAFSVGVCCINSYAPSLAAEQKDKPQPLDESCWRDDVTGDWIIGIYPEGVVYDSKFWEYTDRDEKKGQYLLHNNAGEILSIKIGNEKKVNEVLR